MPRYFVLCICISLLILSGCAVYPTTRTFYEVNPADGVPVNRTSCGYMGTKDSVQRIVENIEITIAPGKENLPSDPTPTLSSWIFFSYPTGKVRIVVDPSKIQVHSGEDVWSPNIVDSFDRDSRRIDGTYNWMGVELKYPAPSGLKDQITFSFQMGALLIDGRAVSIPPFRFTRATKKDVYYGSINC